MASAPHLFFLLLTMTLPAQGEVANFDQALRAADLVGLGRVREVEGHREVELDEVWRGTVPAAGVWLADTANLSLHVGPASDGKRWFVALTRTNRGWCFVQWPGVVRPCETEGERLALRRLVSALGDLEQPIRSPAALLPGHVQLATVELRAFPDLAASALLALARRADLLPQLAAPQRVALQSLLEDEAAPAACRQLAVSCLHGAGDPTLVGRAATLLRTGRAQGLGPVLGRLFASELGPRSDAFLAGLVQSSTPGAAAEIGACRQAAATALGR